MQLFLIIVLIVLGLILLAKGGDIFVDSAITIAKKFRIPTLIIGATIVSVGTTLPEILVSVMAAVGGEVDIAVSNATGSMFCNLTLILGVALSGMSIAIKRKNYIEKFIFAGLNTLLLILFIIDGNISLVESIILLIIFVAFMIINIFQAVKQSKEAKLQFDMSGKDGEDDDAKFSVLTIVLFIVGAVCIALGARFLVDNVVILCEQYIKIPKVIVGATVVALGTSLPELFTAISSIRKKNIDMSIGNVLGANIINGTFLVGISGAIQGTNGMQVYGESGSLAIILSIIGLMVGMIILVLPMLIKKKTYRWQGIVLLFIYVAYILYLVISMFS